MSTEVSTEQLIDGCSPTIFVSDLARAVSFYTKTLGLKVAYQAAGHFAMIDAGQGQMLGLHPPGRLTPSPGSPGSIQVGLTVSQPIEGVVRQLQERGVAFHDRGEGPIVDDGAVKLAYLTDPDGNELYLCEVVRS